MTTITKKKLTLAQAAEQWLKAHAAMKREKALLEEAAGVLKPHLEKSKNKSYRGVGLTMQEQTILDQPAVRAFLGSKLSKFQKSVTKRFLTPLGD